MDFLAWSLQPLKGETELQLKNKYFPNIDKEHLFPEGFFAEDSDHCYGNTVDLVLIDCKNHVPLDMGTIFDFMDETSYLSTSPEIIGEAAYSHRQILTSVMVQFNFEPYEKEYWHFSHGGRAGREIIASLDMEITAQFREMGCEII